MRLPFRLRLLGALETSLILVVLAGHSAFLLSLLGFAAGVDVTPGLSIAATGSAA
jgi:hypothetical protein